MNDNDQNVNHAPLEYQTLRLQNLINEIVQCCEDRKIYESQKFGIPYAELKCLRLFNGERYLTVKGIAQNLDVAKSRVTKLVNGLVKKGLVEAIDDPKDGRIKLINLTPNGQRISEEVDAFHQNLHRKILSQFGPDERKNMLSYLELLHSSMEAVKAQLV
jgi:DNA-binding MarR family transcriptional regulator